MPVILWCDSMLTGIQEVDEQHENLTAMINELYYAYVDGKDQTVLSKIISGVSDYTKDHFSTEERLMKEHEYPDTTAHMQQHRKFEDKSIDFLIAYTEGKHELTSEVLDYLTDWWLNHIQGDDRRLTDFLLELDCQ
ncbi:MAG: bacteriohemerythrin [Desulfovibrio sp.]|uniref:bacteriohemerythrin n=1 Tax=Desulfovibrio sp. 7SRBS1 TaxID=3378064 RepID=UPI003B41EF01